MSRDVQWLLLFILFLAFRMHKVKLLTGRSFLSLPSSPPVRTYIDVVVITMVLFVRPGSVGLFSTEERKGARKQANAENR